MGRLITYDSLNNKMVFNMSKGDLPAIANGASADIPNQYGACHARNDYYDWACGTYSQDFDMCYYSYMRAYEPFNMNHQNEDNVSGFTVTELISRGYLTPNVTGTFYLNEEKTDYVQITANGQSTNGFGTTCYNGINITMRYNGTTKQFINRSGGNSFYNAGLVQCTFNNVTGYYAFICDETNTNSHRRRTATIVFDNFGSLLPYYQALYDNYGGKPTDEIPVTPANEPVGGFSNIASLTGDDIELPNAPDETVSGVLASGFLNIYSPSASQLQSFGGALWTNAFNTKWYDLDSISNLILNAVSDPINFIVGLFMLPVTPTKGNASGIYLGGINVNTVTAPRVTQQYVTIDFGTLNIDELYASYLDYSYSRLSIYLPYIGMADIDVQEVTGGSVTLQYIIDCFTGACVANVKCVKTIDAPWGMSYTNKTVHSYSGNVALQLPISAGSFDVMTQGLINVGLGLVSGQPQTVAKGATDVIQNVGGDATTRGALSSNTGRLCYQTPYLMFTRPIESRPANLAPLHGISAGVGGQLKNFSGFVECSDAKLDGITATDNEKDMIDSLLKSGVYV